MNQPLPRRRRILSLVGLAIVVGAVVVWVQTRPDAPESRGAASDAPASPPARPADVHVPAPPPMRSTSPPLPLPLPPLAPPRPRPPADDDERQAMARIRETVRGNPDQALALIDAADRAHAAGPFAEERAALRVEALVFARRIGPARDDAELFLARYPHSSRGQHIEMLTGVHPRPPDPEN